MGDCASEDGSQEWLSRRQRKGELTVIEGPPGHTEMFLHYGGRSWRPRGGRLDEPRLRAAVATASAIESLYAVSHWRHTPSH